MNTLEKINTELKADKIEVRRWRSKKLWPTANYLVRAQTGKPQTMADGTKWDGWEHVGHFVSISAAAAAAKATAADRNPAA